jgi:hypothetical protein
LALTNSFGADMAGTEANLITKFSRLIPAFTKISRHWLDFSRCGKASVAQGPLVIA